MSGMPPNLDDIERIAAADKVMKMRNVEVFAIGLSPIERQRWANTFRELGAQFVDAARYLDRYVPDANDVPEYLRPGSVVELRKARAR